MNTQKFYYFQKAISILVGITFIVSAVLKQLSIDTFEIYIYSLNLFNYNIATLLARIIIGFELVLGILFILNFYHRIVKLSILSALITFSVFLFIEFILGSKENCNCFGEFIDLNPLEALLKNIVFIGLLMISGKGKESTFRFKKHLVVAFFILSFSIPIILSPPDFIHNAIYARHNSGELPTSKSLSQFIEEHELEEGNYVLCFFSLKCKYCKLAANKISMIAKRLEEEDKIRYIFAGKENEIETFWKESNAMKMEYFFIESRQFMQIIGGRVPTILFVENGRLKQIQGYRGVSEKNVHEFLRK